MHCAAEHFLERRQYADDGSAKRIDVSSYDADGRLISQTAYGIPMGGVYQPVDEEGNPLPMPDDGLEGLQLLSVVNYQDGPPPPVTTPPAACAATATRWCATSKAVA
ncbi:hypothetical protein ACULLZ_00520 [Xanthomonas arboricola pv. corylina]|uniref:hypothetical protein n=1 Tax=Xanthomonas arboricola TaxID=56448 RepID=UPI0040408F90